MNFGLKRSLRLVQTFLLLASLFVFAATGRMAFAQTPDAAALAVQVEQMRSEIEFVRRQVEIGGAAGTAGADAGQEDADAMAAQAEVMARIDALEQALEQVEQSVSRLVSNQSRQARQVELLEQRVAMLGQSAAATPSPDLETVANETENQVVAQVPPTPAVNPLTDGPTAASVTDTSTTTSSAPISATAIMAGALLNPGPVVKIETRDAQGVISRPIPIRRPRDDLDPTPLSPDVFASLTQTAQAAGTSPDVQETQEVNEAARETSESGGDTDAMQASMADEEMTDAVELGDDDNAPLNASADGGARLAYDAAYALIESNDLPDAERAFTAFLAAYPNDPLASNASYWLGESHYARGELNDAMRAFAGSVRNYRSGRKAPDSLLKLGITLGALGQTAEACRLLSFLPLEYEDASADLMARAQAESTKLNCPS